MSRFFTDLEEEKKEIKKKFVVPQKTTEKLSKKDKLLNELENRVRDLEKNPKSLKKFISDLKKYEVLGLPDFLEEFLLSEKVYIKNNKKNIDEYINKFKVSTKEEDTLDKDITNNKKEEIIEEIDEDQKYDDILNIKDKNIRIEKMKEFLKEVENVHIKINILVHLLSTYTKDREISSIYEIFYEILSYYDNQKAKHIIDTNLNFYLDLFKNSSDKKINYQTSLEKVKLINYNIFERRNLEIEYDNKNYIETSQLDFKLVKLMNENKLIESIDVLKEINFKEIYDDIFINNIYKYSFYLLENMKYKEVYDCYLYIYNNTNNFKNIKRDLYILCVILNHDIKKEEFFKSFINDFKKFGSNMFVLRSNDEIFETFRAFYLLHNYDIEGCYNIINNMIPVFKDKKVLENIINKF